jgi:hypothetical protein
MAKLPYWPDCEHFNTSKPKPGQTRFMQRFLGKNQAKTGSVPVLKNHFFLAGLTGLAGINTGTDPVFDAASIPGQTRFLMQRFLSKNQAKTGSVPVLRKPGLSRF